MKVHSQRAHSKELIELDTHLHDSETSRRSHIHIFAKLFAPRTVFCRLLIATARLEHENTGLRPAIRMTVLMRTCLEIYRLEPRCSHHSEKGHRCNFPVDDVK